jgi:hypothetical protein
MAIRTGAPFGLHGINSGFGCGCDSKPKLGAAADAGASHSETARDLIAAGIAFGSILVYPKVAPRKWPKPKNLWQNLGVLVGVYFATSWAYNKIEDA